MRYIFMLTVIFICQKVYAADDLAFKTLGNGWNALVKQEDPFDSTKQSIIHIIKGEFTFDCRYLNFETGSEYSGYDSFNWPADIQFKVDTNAAVKRNGRYSTYLNGSDIVNDERTFSFKMTKGDIEAFKSGTTLKVSGKFSGWSARQLNVSGFTSAYENMCPSR
jgi:hypothetical protein